MNLAGIDAQIKAVKNLLAFDLDVQVLDFQERHPRNPFTHIRRLLASCSAPRSTVRTAKLDQTRRDRHLAGFARQSVHKQELADTSFQADGDQLLRLNSELHRELLQHILDEAIDDE